MKYLTNLAYTIADDGISLSDVSSLTLARTIQRAESDVDAYMGFDLRLGGFEPHTGWVQSQWDARMLKTRVPNYPVPMRQPLRYRIQVSNITTSGAGFMATIQNNDVAMNVFDQYVEIVPLQSITYSLAPVLVSLGLRPPLVQLDYEAGYFLPVFGEQLIDSNDHKTYYAARGYWATAYTQALSIQPNTLPPIPPVIYKNGVVQSSGFAINSTEGLVTFSAANASTDIISADYTYTIPDNVRDATILQTSFLLGQRALNKLGMQGLELARSGEQQLKRPTGAGAVIEENTALCLAASHKLMNYQAVPVA